MTSLSIILPDNMAQASQEVASELGISRTQFIRQAVSHELATYRAMREQKAMAETMCSMKNNKNYLKELDELTTYLNADLPEEGEAWWIKKT